jgi:calcium-activated chloride channel regulator 4
MCQTVIHTPKGNTPYRHAQFRVTNKHPIYGEKPYTQQSRGCGQPGDFVALPDQFLTAWNNTWETWGDPAKLFVKEWTKLRYGIFDEHGFNGDLLYPHYYKSNGRILPTGTTDSNVDGEWMNLEGRNACNPSVESDCYFFPTGSNDQVTCSLGYLHYLPSVKHFCPGDNKRAMAPTKHNVLCKGQSASEVIFRHDDFNHPNHQRRTFNADKRIDPEITVVREPETQYVLIIETSASMDNHNQWKWINKAAQKFIRYDLPLHTNLAIVTFSNDSKLEHSMSAIHSDEARARLADTVPDKYHLSHSGDVKCLLCGVQQAIQEVLRGNMAGAHLVLVTRGSADTLSISDEQTIEDYVKYYHIKVSSILMPESEKLPLAFYDSIAQSSGGISHVVPNINRKSMQVYVDLMHAFSGLLLDETPHLPVVLHEELIPMTGYSSSTGTFTVDTTLGRGTTFGIYVDDEEDHLIKSVTFTDSKGFLYGPYTSMSSLYDIINLKTVNFPVGEEPPFDDVRIFSRFPKKV